MALSFCGRRILSSRKSLIAPLRNNGYIVLVPEIGEESPEKNPLLQNDGLPQFNQITIENCMAAIAKQTLEFESAVRTIERSVKEDGDVFEDILKPLEELCVPLEMTWGLSKTLYLGNSSLMPTKNYLSIHERAKKARATKYNSAIIYNNVKANLEKSNFNEEQTRVLKKFMLEGKLNGLELDGNQKQILSRHLNNMAKDKTQFRQKVEIATKRFSHKIEDGNVVRDFPEELLKEISPDPKNKLKGPWKVTLSPSIYLPIMEHCPDRQVRWNTWNASVTRCSGYGDRELQTSLNLEEIRFARREMAKVLGFSSFAEMSMETKMAGNVDTVRDIFKTLLVRAKPAQDRELESLYQFAVERGFKGARIELWDVPFWRRKQQQSLFNFKEEDFRPYFPLNNVLEGLFQLCQNLFDIVIKQRGGVSGWHKDVKFYDVFESHSSAPVAGFYMDPYARSKEKIIPQGNNGWMVGIQNNSRVAETKPLAALIFNFDAPIADKPSVLHFREVKTLFHRFGLALQHLLSRANYADVSGSSNIEWDAVEVSGHVMSHWLLNENIIDSISGHYESGDKLPKHMFQSLTNIHKHLAGVDLCKELYLGALDLELHHTKDYWLEIVRKLWPQYRSFPLDKYDSHACSFTQIFVDDWAAAYFSNVWSRMIAADVYSSFHEVRGDSQKIVDVGKRFRDTFLALGGSCHPSTVFRKFRGRDPSPKALLKSLGLKEPTVQK